MKCYQWKVTGCGENDPTEQCEYVDKKKWVLDSGDIYMPAPTTAVIRSPRFNSSINNPDKALGRRYFCVYNASLSCPSGLVDIRQTESRNNWPMRTNTDCQTSPNYLAFYEHRDNNSHRDKYCGPSATRFEIERLSDSFLAVLWTDTGITRGTFEFEATCKDPELTTTEEGGSGDVLIQAN